MKWNKKYHPRFTQAWVYKNKNDRQPFAIYVNSAPDFKWRKWTSKMKPQKAGWRPVKSEYTKKGNWVVYYGDRYKS